MYVNKHAYFYVASNGKDSYNGSFMPRGDLPTPKVHSSAGRIIPKANIPTNTPELLPIAISWDILSRTGCLCNIPAIRAIFLDAPSTKSL